MSSVSGFACKELYEELEKILCASNDAHKDPKEWERAIKILSELISSPKQMLQILVFFVNFVSKYLDVYNLHVWNMINHSIKRTIYACEHQDKSRTHFICHYIGKLFIICAICPKKLHADFFKKVAYLEYVQPQIESLMYESWICTTFQRYIQTYATELTTMGKKKLCVFLFALERKNKTLIYAVLHDLLLPRSCYVQSNSDAYIDKDMLWYVWGTFINYVNIKIKDKMWTKWLRDMYALSKFQFRKDKRKQRIHLLLFSVRIFLDANTEAEEYKTKINYAIPSISKDMTEMVEETKLSTQIKRTSLRKKPVSKAKDIEDKNEGKDEDDALPEYLNFIPLISEA